MQGGINDEIHNWNIISCYIHIFPPNIKTEKYMPISVLKYKSTKFILYIGSIPTCN